jgi:hypothetical protein
MTGFRYQNQGQQITLGWDNESLLKNWTAYIGNDGRAFLPPNDRTGFSDGVERRLNTGGVFMAGFNISRQTFPWISDGQIAYLESTFSNQNVTVSVHRPGATGKEDTTQYNAVFNMDLNQLQTLTRRGQGYVDFVVELILVEAL